MIPKRNQYLLSIILFLLGVGLFAFTLDRYPAFCIDEPFFNVSAVRHLEGKSFAYKVHSEAPCNGELWSFHAPLFFRMQVLTHRMLGISHFAARFPSYFAGNVAAFLLALLLISRGRWKEAFLLQILWLGDRSLLENMGGRQEGISHLCVVFAAVLLLLRAHRSRSRRLHLLVGFLIGVAAGLNPAGIYYALAVVLVLALTLSRREAIVRIGLCAVGGALSGLLVIWCWLPDLHASWSQFLWHYRFNARLPAEMMFARALSSWRMLKWALPWTLALLFSCLGATVYVVLAVVRRMRKGPIEAEGCSIFVVAACFSSVSLAMYLSSSLFSTYLVYVTTWAMLFIILVIRKVWRVKRGVAALMATVCVLAWLPSAAWNALRFREAVTTYGSLDSEPVVEVLRTTIPDGADVFGDPHLYVEAHEANLDFTPLHWYISDAPQEIPDTAWIVVSSRYDAMMAKRPEYLQMRALVGNAVYAADSKYHRRQYKLYSPAQ